MNKNYQKGYALEREMVNLFKQYGYSAVRAAGSHSAWDVFVWYTGAGIPSDMTASQVLTLYGGFELDTIYPFPVYHRRGKKYHDRVYVYTFGTRKHEGVSMLQCKRKAR